MLQPCQPRGSRSLSKTNALETQMYQIHFVSTENRQRPLTLE
jgi:hypothetical protein